MADGVDPKANGTKGYAIILGAKVNGEIPSLSLQYRLDAALDYAQQYPHVYLILSGGQGAGEHISEAEAMKRFLIENGIQEERLFLEDMSTSTYENLLYSIEKIPDSIEEITIITSDYHLARAKNIAESLGLQTDVVAAKTPKIVELKLRTRERLALIKTVIVGK
ncbi:YdcF family protein [Sporosarcina sp. Marseille-Q4063]|uniref:YdcF family protein n=1 Tax=Sporosarcina sp. Marseille-Q4063 TaxID=2810514 RepID=UPI001BB037B4|nr:YdcF family protein [Sporosarcina sp. Marseille-Q4063]QUW22045.1 YdcF family protein [Sporosarcina sp. Marseille-Q4063]